jgi:hypothetical protein
MLDINNERITSRTQHLCYPYRTYLRRHPCKKKTLWSFLKDRGHLASMFFFLTLGCILKIVYTK